MRTIAFTVHGKPIAQPRQRMRNAGKFIQSYTPASHPVTEWKRMIQITYSACEDAPRFAQGEPLEVIARFTMPRPKSHLRANGEIKPGQDYWHTKKPDGDNLIKAVLDALTKAGAYHDDSQIAKTHIEKCYTTHGNMETGLSILIKPLASPDA